MEGIVAISSIMVLLAVLVAALVVALSCAVLVGWILLLVARTAWRLTKRRRGRVRNQTLKGRNT